MKRLTYLVCLLVCFGCGGSDVGDASVLSVFERSEGFYVGEEKMSVEDTLTLIKNSKALEITCFLDKRHIVEHDSVVDYLKDLKRKGEVRVTLEYASGIDEEAEEKYFDQVTDDQEDGEDGDIFGTSSIY